MKTIKNILAIIGILIFASGCTLMLDEPPADGNDDTPNGDGFTAPRTEQTEFGDVTYQFQDGVRLINEKYVPYIISCRNDSTLGHTEILFTKNIPSDLLPQRGDYIATTMSQLFQQTLCDEVDNIEETGGGYLLISHPVPLIKVFKELDISIDARIAGDYEDSSEQSRSGGNIPKLKGFRLVPRHNSYSRGEEVDGEFSESLFSFAFWDGDESKLKEFETNPADYHDWTDDFDPPLSILFASVRSGGSATHSATRVGLASYQNVKLKFSLKNGFDLELSNDLVQTYSFRSEACDRWEAFPAVGSTGMTVPKDGILHENRWTKYDYGIPLPVLPSIGLDAYVAKFCIDFNFAFAYDEASKITGDKVFRYEGAQKTQFFKWNMKTDKNYETTVNRSKSLDVTDPRLRKDLSNTVFQYATRGFLHIDIGFTLGAATLDISPLRVNLDVSCTHKMTNDGSKSKPSTLKAPGKWVKEYTYEATDKSLDEWKGTLAVGLSTDMKGGADLGDLADYYDWFKHAAVSLKWVEGSMVLWRIADSAYPVIEYQQTYTPSNYTYHGTVTLPHPGKIGWFSVKEDIVRDFWNLELLIYDENFNFIKRAKCTTSDEESYPYEYTSIFYGKEYGFDFTLDNTELPPFSKYFYVVPAYQTCTYSSSGPRFFSKPLKYTTRLNSGQINGVETLWVENDDKYCKPGYCLDGIAMDADCLFNGSSPANVNVKVEFFDSDGRNVMSKDFQYAIGTSKGGKIKAIYLINHRIETVIDKAKVTLWYDDPNLQTSVDPSARKVILDEFEVVYDDNTEWWPVFDYADTSYWTQQGYRIGR